MKASSTLGRISATLLANFGPNGFCIKDLVSLEDDSEEMLLKVLNHLVGQKVRNRKRVAMRDYQGRIYEDDCICPDCIHCDPVADECRKGRWRYPTDGCFDFVSRDGKETGLGEMLKRIKVVKND